jgi:predicted secreted protein
VTASSTSTPGTRPVPRTVTPADDGARFTMPEGTTTTLRVQDPSAPDPVVEGAALLLVPVVNVTDSGAREWELRAVAPGTSSVTGHDPDYAFVVTVA